MVKSQHIFQRFQKQREKELNCQVSFSQFRVKQRSQKETTTLHISYSVQSGFSVSWKNWALHLNKNEKYFYLRLSIYQYHADNIIFVMLRNRDEKLKNTSASLHFKSAIPRIILWLQGKHKAMNRQEALLAKENLQIFKWCWMWVGRPWQSIHTSSSNLTSLPLHFYTINSELEFLFGKSNPNEMPGSKKTTAFVDMGQDRIC